ncbi:hypothetical protein L3Q82_006754 [Scortum barcoo]|uniref:Uncharacterized protein n=1 Tax=Scortum barcoo TaxID=214431 RepID=A0ACB8WX45_9TELE|nr:hypothetical protein L3Q82_006754 [Scortum barcoo]
MRPTTERRSSTLLSGNTTEHQQDQGGHSGLQEVQEDRAHFLSSLLIHGEAVERVNNIKFLGIHITSDLTWSMNHEHSSPEAPQWLLIQCLFTASDDGFQMRLRYNESDMSM